MLHSLFSTLGIIENKGPLLFKAIEDNDEAKVIELLSTFLIPSITAVAPPTRRNEFDVNLLILAKNSKIIVNALLNAYGNKIGTNSKGLALVNAAIEGYTQIVESLLTHDSDKISTSYKCHALCKAIACGHSQIVETLLTRCSDVITAAFHLAAYGGYNVRVMERLLTCCSNEISIYDKGLALRNAATEGYTQIVESLLTRYSYQINLSDKREALLNAAQKGHLETVNTLLADASVASLATHGNNMVLIEARQRARGGPEDAACYQPIVDRLLQIEAVRILDQEQATQVTNLGHLTQFAENAMSALTANENVIVASLKKHYEASYNDKGWEQIRVEILSYLEAAYRQSPALDEHKKPLPLHYTPNLSQKALHAYYQHPIHSAWRYLSERNPWMSPKAQYVQNFADGGKAAMIAECDKALISYLWLALNAPNLSLEPGFTVEGNLNIFAVTLAEPNRSHNHDERPVNKADKAAWKNRIPNIPTTRADDLKGDKPTCEFGLTTRLLQSTYGHPQINCPDAHPLSPEIIRVRMESWLFQQKERESSPDNIVDKLNRLPLHLLQYLEQALNDALESGNYDLSDNVEGSEVLREALTISELQLSDFIEKTKLWFGPARIEGEQQPPLVFNEHRRHLAEEIKHPHYIALIRANAKQPLLSFATALNDYLNLRILVLKNAASDQKPKDALTFTNTKKRLRDEEKSLDEASNDTTAPESKHPRGNLGWMFSL